MKRVAIATDVNDVAYCVTKAKVNAPALPALRRRITQLENAFEPEDWEPDRRRLPLFFRRAYRASTLRQLLYLRSRLRWASSDVDCMLAALVLGSLHGESATSPSYLSNQMPRTISTKPAYSIRFWEKRDLVPPKRDAFALLRSRAAFRYESAPAAGRAAIYHADMRKLPRLLSGGRKTIRCAVTSPPYFNVTNFEEDQWLRLWFLGGPPWPTRRRVSQDDRHESLDRYWRLIADMWRVFGVVLAPKADVVLRIGALRLSPEQIVSALTGSTVFAGRKVELVSTEVSEIRGRQTDVFRPGARGCLVEVDCHFALA